MTVKDLINRLKDVEDLDKVIIISDGKGWTNIDKMEVNESNITLTLDNSPLFHEN